MRKSIDHVNEVAATAPTAEALFDRLHGVMHLVRWGHQRLLRGVAAELAPMDARVLGFFARHPGGTQTDLALHSGRDKGQIARLVAGLRERGLLDGEADPADRRSLRLRLTPEGEALHKASRRQARRLYEDAASALSDDERRQLAALLAKLEAGLEAAQKA